jgi:hypothetical protein
MRPRWMDILPGDARFADGAARLTLMAGIDMGGGAGCMVILTVPDGANSAGLLKSIVRSIRIDEAQLSRTLAKASAA